MTLQTEFEFILPRGYVDAKGNLHKQGRMRMATAMDEIAPLRDLRVKGNQAYLAIILLAQVITKLGSLSEVHTGVIEKLFSADFAYLQDFYRRINEDGTTGVPTTCPECSHKFEVDLSRLGGS
ncbi:MAG: phage tail assembly protein [Dehalococcoidia bacterium]|nr:phage tail assembly protein [Dehalococcoidia bacterium]